MGLKIATEANNRIARTPLVDFGTCAIDWPLMDEWDNELASGKMPQ